MHLAETVKLPNNIVLRKAAEPSLHNTRKTLSEDFQGLLSGFSDDGLGSEGLKDAISLLSQHSVNNSSPGYFGKLVSAPSPPGTATDLFLNESIIRVSVSEDETTDLDRFEPSFEAAIRSGRKH